MHIRGREVSRVKCFRIGEKNMTNLSKCALAVIALAVVFGIGPQQAEAQVSGGTLYAWGWNYYGQLV